MAEATETGLKGVDNIPLDRAQIANEKLLQEQAVVVLNERVESQQRALDMKPDAIRQRAIKAGADDQTATGGTLAKDNVVLKPIKHWYDKFLPKKK